jgi:hypothetical protein
MGTCKVTVEVVPATCMLLDTSSVPWLAFYSPNSRGLSFRLWLKYGTLTSYITGVKITGCVPVETNSSFSSLNTTVTFIHKVHTLNYLHNRLDVKSARVT